MLGGMGAHGDGDQKCLVRERQVKVARVRVVQKVLCAETMNKVEEDGSRMRIRRGISKPPLPSVLLAKVHWKI